MNGLVQKSTRFAKRNASTILSGVGGIGVIATSVMAVKATPKAIILLEQAKEEKGEELTKFEVVRTAGLVYIPAVLVGVSTIACIFGAHVLNKRQQAALMSAYAMLDNTYKQYQTKVKDIQGEEVHDQVKEEMLKDHYKESNVIFTDEEQLFYDDFSRRFFTSTMNDVMDAEYKFNRNFSLRDYADLNEFYTFLGLEEVEYGFYMGWNKFAENDYGYRWIDFYHKMTVLDDGRECCVITMPFEPHYDFMDY